VLEGALGLETFEVRIVDCANRGDDRRIVALAQ
jgi:hypothetical protein